MDMILRPLFAAFFSTLLLLAPTAYLEAQINSWNQYTVTAPETLAGAIASSQYVIAFTSQGPLVLSPQLQEIPESHFFTSQERPFPPSLPFPQSGIFLTDELALVQDARTGRLWILDVPRGLPLPGPSVPHSLVWMTHQERVFFFEGPFLKELVSWEGKVLDRGSLLDLPLVIRGWPQIQYLSWDSQSLWQVPFPTEEDQDLPQAQEWKIPQEWGSWEDFGWTQNAFWFLTPSQLKTLSGSHFDLPESLPKNRKLFFSPLQPYLLEFSSGILRAPGQEKPLPAAPVPPAAALQKLRDHYSYPQALRMALESPLLLAHAPLLRKAMVGFGRVEKTLEGGFWKVALIPDISFRPTSPPTWEGREGSWEEGAYVWRLPEIPAGILGVKRPLLGVLRSGEEETWFNIP